MTVQEILSYVISLVDSFGITMFIQAALIITVVGGFLTVVFKRG